ncbi:Do family serine endopeptidase [Candidatus Nitrospira neomarina]|uniref:Do family serine endopeptidase n=1 Tax=Candidatus Nitrospira neomarina TaxID=3020899 RepID=A0AA96GLB8_9BACT|nr:Do family serine endopeptidase [Candidatus Nitrospira neomarina]WNM63323.1 Do family serine endopeptidase [Candidatus Nitrospira neomarina]
MMHMSRLFAGPARPFRIAPPWGFLVLFVGLGMVGGFLGNGWFVPAQTQAAIPGAFIEGFSEIVEKVGPAVVNVAVTGGGGPSRGLPPGPFGGPPGGGPPGGGPPGGGPPGGGPGGPPGMSAGSGVIIDSRGYILTNNHVVEDASDIKVSFQDGREMSATVVGTDPKTDLAVIKVKLENGPLPSVAWGEYESLRVGDVVLALGSPFGLRNTVSLGIISALGRGSVGITEYEDFIQTDAAINPGNSGGALVNMKGELIGINTAIFSRTGGSEGVGFAIAVSIAKDIAASLIETGKVVRGWMGVAIQELTPALAQSFQLPEGQQGGVLISEVHEDGPSAKAGLQRGDVILEYGGEAVKDVNHLRNIVARTKVGKKKEIKVLREGKETMLTLELGERPSDQALAKTGPVEEEEKAPAMAKLDNVLSGMTVAPISGESRSEFNIPEQIKGVVVSKVESGSAVEAAGIQVGDVIQEVSRQSVKTIDDFKQVASKIAKDELAVLLVNRRGNNLFIAVNPQ